MSKYTFDEICESQDFDHDQEFTEYEHFNAIYEENQKIKKQLSEAILCMHDDTGKCRRTGSLNVDHVFESTLNFLKNNT